LSFEEGDESDSDGDKPWSEEDGDEGGGGFELDVLTRREALRRRGKVRARSDGEREGDRAGSRKEGRKETYQAAHLDQR